MKRQLLPFLALLLALTACGMSAGGGEPDGTPMEKNPDYVDITTPGAPAPLSDGTDAADDEHSHTPSEEDHTVEHEPAGYCGNTMTTISRETRLGGEPWEASFDGSDSVALTDLLLYLDYSGPVCRCLPEYNIDTEFGSGYGINLTESYARHDGGQVSLTAEQVEQIQGILDRLGETNLDPEIG